MSLYHICLFLSIRQSACQHNHLINTPDAYYSSLFPIHCICAKRAAIMRLSSLKYLCKKALKKGIRSGSYLLSRAVSSQVSSALQSLTTVFGMGTGVASVLSPPDLFLISSACTLKTEQYMQPSFLKHLDKPSVY